MALSISRVPIPPGICHFFLRKVANTPRWGHEIHAKQKHRETLKCVQIMPYSKDVFLKESQNRRFTRCVHGGDSINCHW